MENIIYVASDCSGMTESDLLCYIEYLRGQDVKFCFSEWFAEEDFLDKVVYKRLSDQYE